MPCHGILGKGTLPPAAPAAAAPGAALAWGASRPSSQPPRLPLTPACCRGPGRVGGVPGRPRLLRRRGQRLRALQRRRRGVPGVRRALRPEEGRHLRALPARSSGQAAGGGRARALVRAYMGHVRAAPPAAAASARPAQPLAQPLSVPAHARAVQPQVRRRGAHCVPGLRLPARQASSGSSRHWGSRASGARGLLWLTGSLRLPAKRHQAPSRSRMHLLPLRPWLAARRYSPTSISKAGGFPALFPNAKGECEYCPTPGCKCVRGIPAGGRQGGDWGSARRAGMAHSCSVHARTCGNLRSLSLPPAPAAPACPATAHAWSAR